MNQILSTISDFLIGGFISTTIILTVIYLTVKKWRQTLKQLVIISNSYLLFGSLLSTLPISQFLSHYVNFSTQEKKYITITRLTGPYWFIYLGPLLFRILIPQLLWIRKFRQSMWFSVIILPFLLIGVCTPAVNDYFSSSGSGFSVGITISLVKSTIYMLGFSTLVTVTWWWKNRKLYP